MFLSRREGSIVYPVSRVTIGASPTFQQLCIGVSGLYLREAGGASLPVVLAWVRKLRGTLYTCVAWSGVVVPAGLRYLTAGRVREGTFEGLLCMSLLQLCSGQRRPEGEGPVPWSEGVVCGRGQRCALQEIFE